VQEEEHYEAAAKLFSTLPGLAEKPIKVVAEMTLLLSYYARVRESMHVLWQLSRAPTLRSASVECMPYKDVKLR